MTRSDAKKLFVIQISRGSSFLRHSALVIRYFRLPYAAFAVSISEVYLPKRALLLHNAR
jgi:hypothetical protein